jgi:hypothetical protein
MSDDPILIEDKEGLNVVTTLDEARERISLLCADNRHLRKATLMYKEEINKLYEALAVIRQAMIDGIDIVLEARKVR